MTSVALALILLSACIHATWNLVAKRAGAGGAHFIWLVTLLNTIIYAPLAAYVYVTQRPELGPTQLVLILGSAVLQLAYFISLQRGYATGDLSVVYPLARGTGPMLATLAAILIFAERPTPLALAGAALIGIGALTLTGGLDGLRQPQHRSGVGFGLLTGLIIASYTIWDKRAVSVYQLPPVFYDWSSALMRCLLLAPFALRQADRVRLQWQTHKREAFVVATLSPLAYILVLTALSTSPVSYVAPAREISILLGAFLGTRVLNEPHARRKLIAAGVMAFGVMAIALG